MVRPKYTFTIISIMLLVLTAATLLPKTRAATGEQLVFTAYADNNAQMEIYLLDVDSGNVQNLTNNASGTQTNPAWSPDGKSIAYISALPSSQDAYNIVVMDVATRENRILAANGLVWSEPVWSPDGKQIAYWSYDKDKNGAIYIVNSDSGEAQRLGDTGRGGGVGLSWSPDGTHILYSSSDGLYTATVDDGTATNLTIDKDRVSATFLAAGAGVWSPDGTQIAFVANWEPKSLQIYTMNADGSNPQLVIAQTDWQIGPTWFPDGKRLVFTYESSSTHKLGQLYTVQADGSEPTQLTDQMELYLPKISPDGSQIAYIVSNQNRNQTDLYLVTLGQAQPTPLTHGEYHNISRLAWRPILKP